MKLSRKQKFYLEKAARPLLPAHASMGMPGWPQHFIDMRSGEALERRGLVTMTRFNRNGILQICVVLTDAGRAALASH